MSAATLAGFKADLKELVRAFQRDKANLDEATTRLRFINPFFVSLGWELGNLDLPLHAAEVVVESQADTAGRQKKVDYLFRIAGMDQFVCEAKRPSEDLSNPKHQLQVQNYTYRRKVYLGVLTNFDSLHVYVVGAPPNRNHPRAPVRVYHCADYENHAAELWDLLARDNVANGSLVRFCAGMPKPGRTRSVDDDFLDFLDKARASFAKKLVDSNPRFAWGDTRLNEAVQRILDRILFVRVCEDRDIDTFRPLHRLIEDWQAGGSQPGKLWASLLELFRRIAPQFNGGLFGKRGEPPHFSDSLKLDDAHLASFVEELSREDSTYNFNDIQVEIIGSVYERFLTKVIHVTENGTVAVRVKPELRKLLGAVYTPRYIVNYIVEQAVGKLLAGKSPKQIALLRIIDIACGSGAFLLRTFERICEQHAEWYSAHPKEQTPHVCYRDAQGRLHLTAGLKRQIMRRNIFGVDIDPQAVEVAQLSLYLKILEGETRHSLNAQRELFPQETLLPDLSRNIIRGNSLIGTDIESGSLFKFSEEERRKLDPMDFERSFPEVFARRADAVREEAEPYGVARSFTREGGRRTSPASPEEARGFDAIVGNPPWRYSAGQERKAYFESHYHLSEYQTDFYVYFVERAIQLLREGGSMGMILSDSWIKGKHFARLRTHILRETDLQCLTMFDYPPFEGAAIESSIIVLNKGRAPQRFSVRQFKSPSENVELNVLSPDTCVTKGFIDIHHSGATSQVIAHVEKNSQALETFCKLNRGVHAYRTDGYGRSKFSNGPQTKRDKDEQSYHSQRKLNSTYFPEVKGKHLERYFYTWDGTYISYGEWLAEARSPELFFNPKLAIRKIIARKLVCTFVKQPTVLDQSVYVAIRPSNERPSLLFLLGVLASSVGGWYVQAKHGIYDTLYPWFTKEQLALFPVPKLNFNEKYDAASHDKLVELVEHMLAAKKELAKAKADADHQYHERRCTTLDQQIDDLVYQLYGFTAEDKAIVEGTQK